MGDYLTYWGKARPQGSSPWPFHPLAYHSLDVAAVGQALLDADPALRRRLGALLGLDGAAASRLMVALLALHDIGKFAAGFQAKRPDLFEQRTGSTAPRPLGERHDACGHALWTLDDPLKELCRARLLAPAADPLWGDALEVVALAVLDHHGRPTAPRGTDLRQMFSRAGRGDARAFASAALDLLCAAAPVDAPYPGETGLKRASWFVAGLAVLSDWIGSHQGWFRYHPPTLDLAQYWTTVALPRAVRAIAEAGVLPAPSAGERPFGALFPRIDAASPLQRWAETVAIGDGPSLFVIEELTGAGKTEAALVLAHRLIAGGHASGLVFALPTMATANAMYARIAHAYRGLYSSAVRPSLVLSHGARALNDDFRDSILPIGDRADAPYDAAGEEETASASCSRWLADDRRRAMLADVGVGTVDQAILAVLPSRYQSLRLVGLARRVLVIDEVHAYDAYMAREITVLLRFHAALGGSAVLLSATLPTALRRNLLEAFRTGRELAAGAVPSLPEVLSRAYPLACRLDDRGLLEDPVAPHPAAARRVAVEPLPDAHAAADAVVAAARDGRCACWIRNTVADVRDGYAMVATQVPSALLFHARFAMVDRLRIEREVLRLFGSEGALDRRRGRVLVASQVVEQSLDLDFDVLVSDLAPIDALIQRAGRLWRHRRAGRSGEPVLQVVMPRPDDDAPAGWYRSLFPRGGTVYPDHARLWLTAKLLADGIDLPGRGRALIEGVYGETVEDRVPAALRPSLLKAEGKAMGDASHAVANALKLQDGYALMAGAWDSDVRTPTRLGEAQTALRLARWRDGRLAPWAEGEGATPQDPWRAWRLSEVQVMRRYLSEVPIPPEVAAAAAQARADWGKYDESVLVPLVEGDGGIWTATGLDPKGAPVAIAYDEQSGLSLGRPAGA